MLKFIMIILYHTPPVTYYHWININNINVDINPGVGVLTISHIATCDHNTCERENIYCKVRSAF